MINIFNRHISAKKESRESANRVGEVLDEYMRNMCLYLHPQNSLLVQLFSA